MTWAPWNPVATKNKDPKIESLILKVAVIYSNPWQIVNKIPSPIVYDKAIITNFQFLIKMALWAKVVLIPEDNNKIVFNSGTANGCNVAIPWGAQIAPIVVAGVNEL